MQKCGKKQHTEERSVSPSKITHSIVMIPNENDLEELPDKEFKGRITERFRQLKEGMEYVHRTPRAWKNEQPNEIQTSIQTMKIEFNKEEEWLTQSQRTKTVETQSSISQLPLGDQLANRTDWSRGEQSIRVRRQRERIRSLVQGQRWICKCIHKQNMERFGTPSNYPIIELWTYKKEASIPKV